ncbi:PREDICTED: natural killer cells antigen CD94-like [Elephantulus edwardii]|uniref:natural killer cells antigen CD94-like n=1 Tax=Elephantulus edwardii TaxID=28737 RepID=UPI0003F08ED7|nr:PREDICTED: natural killer cells antigen CD94-like [Elephantulus edwardii]
MVSLHSSVSPEVLVLLVLLVLDNIGNSLVVSRTMGSPDDRGSSLVLCVGLQSKNVAPQPVFQTAPWRLISGILGIICILLTIILGILLNKSFNKENIQLKSSPMPSIELQKEFDCCSCPEKWIGYQCNCYIFFNEEKTWKESRNSCASYNSSLLRLRNKDEMACT